jgi:hypothetical protein
MERESQLFKEMENKTRIGSEKEAGLEVALNSDKHGGGSARLAFMGL